jgi:ATP-dependent helicase HepA
MVGHSFPSLPDDGMTATFNRDTALSREDMHFLSWEHPMVSGAMDMVMSGEFGNTAFCTLKLPPLKPGTLMLEAVFTVSCSAPSELQLQRYLPVTPVRVLLDSNGTNLSKVLTPKHIKKLGQKVGRRNAQELVKHAREQIVAMINQAQTLAQEQEQQLVTNARERMNSQQSAELKRMQALAAVNPNIRQEELDYMAQTAQSLDSYLQGAQLRLDAIRVVLVTD